MAWRGGTALVVLLLMAGCSGPIALLHKAEGGAIAEQRQAPPGSDQPYPNLASVPPSPVAFTPVQQAQVQQRLNGTSPDVSPPNPAVLAGLALPDAPPPVPAAAAEPLAIAAPAVVAAAPLPMPAVPPPSVPVALAFLPGSAVLARETATALTGIALARGNGKIVVGGFGEAAKPGGPGLQLALARARRLADALTADGVPPGAIILTAAASGSGGFAQIVY